MAWELRKVEDDLECTIDSSGVHVVINRLEERREIRDYVAEFVTVRADLMTTDGEPIVSFSGSANAVRKHLIRYLNMHQLDFQSQISHEHASYIGYELMRAEAMPHYVQDEATELTPAEAKNLDPPEPSENDSSYEDKHGECGICSKWYAEDICSYDAEKGEYIGPCCRPTSIDIAGPQGLQPVKKLSPLALALSALAEHVTANRDEAIDAEPHCPGPPINCQTCMYGDICHPPIPESAAPYAEAFKTLRRTLEGL